VSYTILYSTPVGNDALSVSIDALTLSAVARALDPGSWKIASVTHDWPSRKLLTS